MFFLLTCVFFLPFIVYSFCYFVVFWFHFFSMNPNIVNCPSHRELNSSESNYRRNLFTTKPIQRRLNPPWIEPKRCYFVVLRREIFDWITIEHTSCSILKIPIYAGPCSSSTPLTIKTMPWNIRSIILTNFLINKINYVYSMFPNGRKRGFSPLCFFFVFSSDFSFVFSIQLFVYYSNQ